MCVIYQKKIRKTAIICIHVLNYYSRMKFDYAN